MKNITVGDNEYILEFSFEAAEHKELVQKMFNIVSGAYLVRHSGADISEETAENVVIEGVSEMVAEIPHICITAFYAGLLENNPMSKENAKKLMKEYMKENKLSYRSLFEDLKNCMADDGFFDLSGLTHMITELSQNIEAQINPKPKRVQPKDHQKKQTSTK